MTKSIYQAKVEGTQRMVASGMKQYRRAKGKHSRSNKRLSKVVSLLVTIFLLSGVMLSALMFLSLTSEKASAGSLFVGGGGPGNYTTIQAAINNAFPGDTIYVYATASTYLENLIITKSINLIGIEIFNDRPIIDGGSILASVVKVINVDYFNIAGFEIINGIGPQTAGVRIESSTNGNISNNEIHDNDKGIVFWSSNESTVYGNRIFNNSVNGIESWGSSNNDFINNIVYNHTEATTSHAFHFSGCPYSGNEIIGNIVYDNDQGIHLEDESPGLPWFWDNLIMNNTVYDYEYNGIHMSMGTNNHIIGNQVYDIVSVPINPRGGISCSSCVNTSIADNTVYNGIYGIDLRADFGGPLLLNYNNIIENNRVYNNDKGIRVKEGTDNTFIGNSIFDNNYSVYLTRQSVGNSFINNSLSNASIDDFYLMESSHAITLNTTFDKDKVHHGDKFSSLTVNWFMHVKVIYSTGSPVAGAFVEVFDNSGSPVANRSTNPEGLTKWIIATEYFEQDFNGDSIGDRIYFTQHNATATDGTLVGYAIPEPFMNESKEVLIILVIVLPDYVPWNTPPPQQVVIINTVVPLASRVKNVGILGAATGSTIAFYNQSTPLSPFKTYAVPSLDIGVISNEYPATWTAPSLQGQYSVVIEVDYYNDIDEIDESNNIYIIEFNVVDKLEPPLITNVTSVNNGNGVKVEWKASPSFGVDYYLIYGGESATSVDLLNPIGQTAIGSGQTWWTNTSAIFAFDEYYYVVRAVNSTSGNMSTTSNTGGHFKTQFNLGLNTFSLPLEPFSTPSLDTLMADMGALSISMLDANDDWQTFTTGPAPNVEMGVGYVVDMPPGGSYVFTGEPASMIVYQDGFGFDDVTRDDLGATVDASGNVTLTWTTIPGAEYYVRWSDSRDGFFNSSSSVLNGGAPVSGPPFVHIGAASSQGENYYMIVPYDPILGLNGSSTYSIGVWTIEFNGNEFFGLPLKPLWGDNSADWYVDQIPNSLGIVYLDNGIWKAHFKEFPEGVYDTTIEFGRGYEVSVYETSRFTFIGW
jgi:parallel beta-helix repeat protein